MITIQTTEDLHINSIDIDRTTQSIKAMSHPLRLKILCTLKDQEITVNDIVKNVGTTQSNISQHLSILHDKGILESRKESNHVYYKICDHRTMHLIGMIQQVYCNNTPAYNQ